MLISHFNINECQIIIFFFFHRWFIPRRIELTPRKTLFRFIFYAIICQLVPLVLVLMTKHEAKSNGMPSYFLKGLTEATRSAQQYFIPPISSMLIICFALLIASYFGFRKLNPIVLQTFLVKKKIQSENLNVNLELIDVHLYGEVKQT